MFFSLLLSGREHVKYNYFQEIYNSWFFVVLFLRVFLFIVFHCLFGWLVGWLLKGKFLCGLFFSLCLGYVTGSDRT